MGDEASARTYYHLGQPVADEDLTDDQRAIMAASETELSISLALGSDIPGEIGAMLEYLGTRGWWVQITSPTVPGDLYRAGLTPHGAAGWNGRPDHQVCDVSLRGALDRAVLLALQEPRR